MENLLPIPFLSLTFLLRTIGVVFISQHLQTHFKFHALLKEKTQSFCGMPIQEYWIEKTYIYIYI